tara:strand:- start:417 stop:728 length:312 start_codon:yes stop_codon:yes gene_type:complete
MEKKKKLVTDSFDKILKTSKEVSLAWNSKHIPLNAFYDILKKSKLKEKGDIKQFAKDYNKTIDLLYVVSKKYCEKNELDNKLPIIILGKYIDVVKAAFLSGAK